ncbi:hypothetical protein BDN72DRAFT_859648, partial [Pluteus cervinus]
MIGQKTLVLSILATTLSALALNLPVASSPSSTTGQLIKPGGDLSKCLEVAGADYENGVPVVMFVACFSLTITSLDVDTRLRLSSNDCNRASLNQYWLVQPGETKIQVANTGYCLDAGS